MAEATSCQMKSFSAIGKPSSLAAVEGGSNGEVFILPAMNETSDTTRRRDILELALSRDGFKVTVLMNDSQLQSNLNFFTGPYCILAFSGAIVDQSIPTSRVVYITTDSKQLPVFDTTRTVDYTFSLPSEEELNIDQLPSDFGRAYSVIKSLIIFSLCKVPSSSCTDDDFSLCKDSPSIDSGPFLKGSLNHWRIMHRLRNMAILQRALTPIEEAVVFKAPKDCDYQEDAELMDLFLPIEDLSRNCDTPQLCQGLLFEEPVDIIPLDEASREAQLEDRVIAADEGFSEILDESFGILNASLEYEVFSNRHELLRPRTMTSPPPSPLSPKPFAKIPIEIVLPADESFNVSNVGSPTKQEPSAVSSGLPKHVHKHLRSLLCLPITFDKCDDVIIELRRIIHAISTTVVEGFTNDLAAYGLIDVTCKVISRLCSHAETFYTALKVVIDVVLNCSEFDARASFYNKGLVGDLAFGISLHIHEPMVMEIAAVCTSTLASGSVLWKTLLVENSVCDMCVEALRLHYDNPSVLERCICAIGVLIDNSANGLKKRKVEYKLRCSAFGFCELLLSVLDRCITDEALVLQGCVALSSISHNCVEIKEKVGRLGGCSVVVRVLQLYSMNRNSSKNPAIILASCIAIYNLSANCRINKALFGRVGALQLLATTATEHSNNSAIVVEAVLSFANIVMSPINRVDLLPSLYSKMIGTILESQRFSAEAIKVLGLAIVNLVYNNTPVSSQLCNPNFVEALLTAMNTHRDEAKVTEHFARCISIQLLLVPEAARRYYSERKVVLLLVDAIKRHTAKFSVLEQSFCSLYHITLDSSVAAYLSYEAASCGAICEAIELLIAAEVTKEKRDKLVVLAALKWAFLTVLNIAATAFSSSLSGNSGPGIVSPSGLTVFTSSLSFEALIQSFRSRYPSEVNISPTALFRRAMRSSSMDPFVNEAITVVAQITDIALFGLIYAGTVDHEGDRDEDIISKLHTR